MEPSRLKKAITKIKDIFLGVLNWLNKIKEAIKILGGKK